MALFTARLVRIPRARLVLYVLLVSALCMIFLFWTGFRTSELTDGKTRTAKWATQKGSHKQKQSSGSRQPKILLVTALYPLAKSKHSDDEYARWLELFLSRIQTDTYFYAPEKMQAQINDAAAKLNDSGSHRRQQFTLNATYPTLFSVPPLFGLQKTYEDMQSKDREKAIHGPELYAVWNAKAFFLDEAVKHLWKVEGREYDFAFWIDAGSFRNEHTYTTWPDYRQIQKVFEGQDDRVFIPIQGPPSLKGETWTDYMGPFDEDVSEGSFFGGTPSAVSWFRDMFYAYHDHYLSLSYFVGKDQTIFNALLLLFPSRFVTVWMKDPEAPASKELRADLATGGAMNKLLSNLPKIITEAGHLGRCKDEWYYYHFFLADETMRENMRDLWDERDRKDGGWWKTTLGWKGQWWMETTRCRVTRHMNVEEVLERKFGKDWKPPPSFLEEEQVPIERD